MKIIRPNPRSLRAAKRGLDRMRRQFRPRATLLADPATTPLCIKAYDGIIQAFDELDRRIDLELKRAGDDDSKA